MKSAENIHLETGKRSNKHIETRLAAGPANNIAIARTNSLSCFTGKRLAQPPEPVPLPRYSEMRKGRSNCSRPTRRELNRNPTRTPTKTWDISWIATATNEAEHKEK